MVDRDNTVELRKVTTGINTGAVTVIEKGLAANEAIVVDGIDRLRQGSKVRVAATVETVRLDAMPSPKQTENAPQLLPAKDKKLAGKPNAARPQDSGTQN